MLGSNTDMTSAALVAKHQRHYANIDCDQDSKYQQQGFKIFWTFPTNFPGGFPLGKEFPKLLCNVLEQLLAGHHLLRIIFIVLPVATNERSNESSLVIYQMPKNDVNLNKEATNKSKLSLQLQSNHIYLVQLQSDLIQNFSCFCWARFFSRFVVVVIFQSLS